MLGFFFIFFSEQKMEEEFDNWKLSMITDCMEMLVQLQDERTDISFRMSEYKLNYGMYATWYYNERVRLDAKLKKLQYLITVIIPSLHIMDYLSVKEKRLRKSGTNYTLVPDKLGLYLPNIKDFIAMHIL